LPLDSSSLPRASCSADSRTRDGTRWTSNAGSRVGRAFSGRPSVARYRCESWATGARAVGSGRRIRGLRRRTGHDGDRTRPHEDALCDVNRDGRRGFSLSVGTTPVATATRRPGATGPSPSVTAVRTECPPTERRRPRTPRLSAPPVGPGS
jgi:hypothetical protein